MWGALRPTLVKPLRYPPGGNSDELVSPRKARGVKGRGGAGEIHFVVTLLPSTSQAAGVSVWASARPWRCFSFSLLLNAHPWAFHTPHLSGQGLTHAPMVCPCFGFLWVLFTFHPPADNSAPPPRALS